MMIPMTHAETSPSRLPEPQASLDEVRRLVLTALADHPSEVYLFGSRAWGGARRTSDIDVGILAKAPLPIALLSRLQETLEESTIPYHVDLVDLATVEPEFRDKVCQKGIRWND
ncbi:Nucleotidyltransferase domain protein [compost metagenome]